MPALRRLPGGPGGPGGLEVIDVPVRAPGLGEVRIAVFAAGVCGTDLHIIDGSYPSVPSVTLGHEIAGTVEAVGPDVDEALIGLRVAPEPAVGCGECEWCSNGYPMHCRRRASLGTHIDGGFAPYVVVPARNLHVLPASLSDRAGALVEPLACVSNALLDPDAISPGDRVIVTGPGSIGILAAQVAVAAGAQTTLVGLARDAPRLAIAARLGLDARSLDEPETRRGLAAEAKDRTINMVVECAGAQAAVTWALASIRPRGRLVQLGLLPDDAEIAMAAAILREVTITSSYGSTPASWDHAIALLADDDVQLEPLVTSVVPLSEWGDAVRQSRNQEGIKTLFDPRLA